MNKNWSQDVFLETFRFAAQAHVNQSVPGSDIPYLYHITLVAMEIIAALRYNDRVNGDFAVQCALLHDVLEDTGKGFDELKAVFGASVAEGVRALTKDSTLIKDKRMQDSIERIMRQPKEIWMVKMADRISNLQPPPAFWDAKKIISYKEEAALVYEKLSEADLYLSKRLFEKINKYQENYC